MRRRQIAWRDGRQAAPPSEEGHEADADGDDGDDADGDHPATAALTTFGRQRRPVGSRVERRARCRDGGWGRRRLGRRRGRRPERQALRRGQQGLMPDCPAGSPAGADPPPARTAAARSVGRSRRSSGVPSSAGERQPAAALCRAELLHELLHLAELLDQPVDLGQARARAARDAAAAGGVEDGWVAPLRRASSSG